MISVVDTNWTVPAARGEWAASNSSLLSSSLLKSNTACSLPSSLSHCSAPCQPISLHSWK